MTFPAVTLCAADYKSSNDKLLDLSDIMIDCYFGTNENESKCSSNDFENFQIINPHYGDYYSCFKFNGGKNATRHNISLLR